MAHFLAVEDGKNHEMFNPVIVWIAIHPNTTNAEAVYNAMPDILNVLADILITDVIVKWYEGLVISLVSHQ